VTRGNNSDELYFILQLIFTIKSIYCEVEQKKN